MDTETIAAPAVPVRSTLPPRVAALGRALGTAAGAGEAVFVAVALFLFSGALAPLVLGSGGAPAEDAALRTVFTALHALALLVVLPRWREVAGALLRHPLTPALVLFALASMVWSDDPAATLRRGAVLGASTVFGAYLAARWSPRGLLRLLGGALGAAAVLSLALALLAPEVGIGSGDHAGDWQGIFPHKNTLGQAMALAAIVFFLLWRGAGRHRWAAAGGLALSLVLLVLSRSASAIAVVAVCAALVPLYDSFRRSRGGRAVPVLIFATVGAGGAAVLLLAHAGTVLGLLGREATLTGRTVLWSAAVRSIGERPVLGHGYEAFWRGWSGGSAAILDAAGWNTPHAHNGYLDVGLELGMVGLAILLAGVATAAARGVRALRALPAPEAAWPLLLLSFLLVYAMSESVLVRPNDLYWILYVAAACAALPAAARPPAQGAGGARPPALSPGVRRLRSAKAVHRG